MFFLPIMSGDWLPAYGILLISYYSYVFTDAQLSIKVTCICIKISHHASNS